ncbi:hypothetical protein HBI56_114270 [Parastagonospora nodorum]|uniref:Uncharacterized protein n=1 Tax=Phaeosphaeria nodorum (strain SN15 / ATCC MYA-4574 / FGSC 10173) TaxID=321614 RepID=A0A7U2I3K9_PHANO|nr:hypothetical protein HBH56_195120 [Parastagonospora nodorum]QRD00514.1 hypothetical protein JI435_415280 [Parastagonospora nodorum SN15]KAH3924832.1 hypothetical protein HBH54_188370 [Parastagonospora nodorum]KAH3953373.1 hypothetical protein HBH53_040520 [Parastagonospora nodorum]KAH3976452.1 hypothetical protein HBH52_117970 [Parastagonospora nodorum]
MSGSSSAASVSAFCWLSTYGARLRSLGYHGSDNELECDGCPLICELDISKHC